ncbi:hypothetical protein BWI96_07830 [Siphonobacter sp. SORGH_AS_0500]|uniref:class I SAM-dependent methyltransferase n=1 Tax=Siphonobacter sp. SORGH_AS_0500 TaxID=1864824 RepID=UPI000CA69960|nr:class I SAM-dependent methyltransferase [Siphonobacter sp. SORGH_AS_0500]PKK37246.1 hypothetical protein BWI96_07830 [Siphonobacter sp. SORGH_AS_0500]
MSHQQQVEHMKELARQLSCPDGEEGIKTGEHMNINNAFMTSLTIDSLELLPGQNVLEIGPGNGRHVNYLLEKYPHVTYRGVDISETMVSEARRLVRSNQAHFQLIDGEKLPFADASFDALYTVNTLYFWKEPLAYAQEMARCLKPGGTLLLAFAVKEFMEHLPFTQHGFELYEEETAVELLQEAGFQIVTTNQQTEEILSNAGHPVVRTFVLITAQK